MTSITLNMVALRWQVVLRVICQSGKASKALFCGTARGLIDLMISDEEDDDDLARRAEAASLFAAAMSHNTQASKLSSKRVISNNEVNIQCPLWEKNISGRSERILFNAQLRHYTGYAPLCLFLLDWLSYVGEKWHWQRSAVPMDKLNYHELAQLINPSPSTPSQFLRFSFILRYIQKFWMAWWTQRKVGRCQR